MKQVTIMVPVTIRFTEFAKAREVRKDLAELGSRIWTLEHDIDVRTDRVKLRDVRDAMTQAASNSGAAHD